MKGKKILYEVFIFQLFLFAITGCSPLSKSVQHNFQAEVITKENYKSLNEIYANSFDTITGSIKHSPADGLHDDERLTILSQLFYNTPKESWFNRNHQLIEKSDKWIKFEFQSDRCAIISMYEKDNFIFSKMIYGKIKNGYFYQRPKIFIIPFIPLIFGYNFERARIGISKNNLLIDYHIHSWGFAIATGSSHNGIASSIYRRK